MIEPAVSAAPAPTGPVINRLGASLGAEAVGVDLRRPLPAADLAALRRAFLAHHVLCLRGQELTPAQFLAAARLFGEPLPQVVRQSRHPDFPEIMILSSGDRDAGGDGGRVVVGAHWHTDNSFKERPCAVTMLLAKALPSRGGDTEFVDMSAAWEALDAATQRALIGRRAVHMYDSPRKGTRIMTLSAAERAETPPVAHPIVRRHPETGRPALYLNPNRISHVEGLPAAASGALLDRLVAHATQPRFVYRHRWQPGDLLLWDNRATMHRANADYPAGERRLMHRIIMAGDRPEPAVAA